MKTPRFCRRPPAFTLIELLVVIAIIAVLMGLAFPAYQSVQNSAKRTQAKNDLTQMVTAVNAFYTEYGRYPSTDTSDVTFGGAGSGNDKLFDELRGTQATTLNPRSIAFINVPIAKNSTNPSGGLGQTDRRWYDPWGHPYNLRLDTDYDSKLDNPYSANAGVAGAKIDLGCIAWSLGKDGGGGSGDKNAPPAKDDVISWQ